MGRGVGAGLFNLGSLLRAAVAKLGPLCGLGTDVAAGGGLGARGSEFEPVRGLWGGGWPLYGAGFLWFGLSFRAFSRLNWEF